MSNVIAGPTIGAMLARAGAEVVKVDPVTPFYGPGVTIIYGIVVNIGKKSILLDVSKPTGRKFLNTLIGESDVIIVNQTSESLSRLNMDAESLSEINPDIILMQFDAWGGCLEKGEYRNFVGYDDNIQAGIGIMERFGGGIDSVEEHAHVGTIDVIAGVAGGFATVVALLKRKYNRSITTCRTSLAAVGQYLQYLHMFKFNRCPSLGKGVHCKGVHALHRFFETSDGHVMIVGTISNDCETVRAMSRRVFCNEECHDAVFLSKTTEQVVDELSNKGTAVAAFRTLKALKQRYTVTKYASKLTYQFLQIFDHAIGQLIMVPPIAIRINNQIPSLSHSPKYGADTHRILSKYNKNHLLLTSVASSAYSRNYIPFTVKCEKCDKQHGAVEL